MTGAWLGTIKIQFLKYQGPTAKLIPFVMSKLLLQINWFHRQAEPGTVNTSTNVIYETKMLIRQDNFNNHVVHSINKRHYGKCCIM